MVGSPRVESMLFVLLYCIFYLVSGSRFDARIRFFLFSKLPETINFTD